MLKLLSLVTPAFPCVCKRILPVASYLLIMSTVRTAIRLLSMPGPVVLLGPRKPTGLVVAWWGGLTTQAKLLRKSVTWIPILVASMAVIWALGVRGRDREMIVKLYTWKATGCVVTTPVHGNSNCVCERVASPQKYKSMHMSVNTYCASHSLIFNRPCSVTVHCDPDA